MLLTAFLVAIGATSAAASALEKRVDWSDPECPKANVYFCDAGNWGASGSDKCNLETLTPDGRCWRFDSKFDMSCGSVGPDPGITCSVYYDNDPGCTKPVWTGGYPGVPNFYDTGSWGWSYDGFEVGHRLRYYRCTLN